MREMLATTAALYGQGAGNSVALITDGRFSGATSGFLHRPCRPGSGGWRAYRLLKDGDMISIDAEAGTITVDLSKKNWQSAVNHGVRAQTDYQSGTLWKYAQTVGSAEKARPPILAAGPKTHVFADI